MHSGVRSQPGFRWLWLAVGASAVGSFVGSLAMGFVLVDSLGASTAGIAFVAVVQLVAGAVASPLVGVLADRHRRRRLMIGADLGRAAVLCSLPVLDRLGLLSIGAVSVVGALSGIGDALFNASYGGHLAHLVGRDRLVGANSLIAATTSVAETAGFALAGTLVGLVGAPLAVGIDGLSFAVSAACLLAIRVPELPGERGPSRRAPRAARRAEALAGFGIIRRDPVLRPLMWTSTAYDVTVAMIGVSHLLYLRGRLGFAPALLTPIFAVGGITSLAGAWAASRAERAGRFGPAMAVAGLVRSVGVLAVPLTRDRGALGISLLVANQTVTDPAWNLQEIAESSIRVARSPEAAVGRVSAAHGLAGRVGRLVGSGAAAVIGEAWGPRWVLWIACGLCGVTSVALVVSPVRRVERAAPAAEPTAA